MNRTGSITRSPSASRSTGRTVSGPEHSALATSRTNSASWYGSIEPIALRACTSSTPLAASRSTSDHKLGDSNEARLIVFSS
jgi:hypothetical protein